MINGFVIGCEELYRRIDTKYSSWLEQTRSKYLSENREKNSHTLARGYNLRSLLAIGPAFFLPGLDILLTYKTIQASFDDPRKLMLLLPITVGLGYAAFSTFTSNRLRAAANTRSINTPVKDLRP